MASEYVCVIWDKVVKTSLWTNAPIVQSDTTIPDDSQLNQLHPTMVNMIRT